ncbi:MAG TPA: efflux RND transporter periplasmic adaptor subunit [Burkholderiales bacterium]|nr:efflux RND transporter periplasmic adaptor subunit [Burkholderiales bacterium]
MRFLAPILVLAFLSACGGGADDKKGAKGGPGAGMPPPEVVVSVVEPKAIPVTFEYAGQTAGSRVVEVRARVSGILVKRNFTEGEPVKQGQSLYTIDPAPFEAAVARAEADVAAAQARYEQAQRNAARLKPLIAEKAVSQKEADDAMSGEAVTGADLKAARARLTEARLALGYTRVEAPAAGLASRSERSEGSLVSGPDVLLTTVIQVNPIWVNFGIPDNEQARIQKEVEAGRLALPKNGNVEVALRLADGSMYAKTGKLNFSDVRISPQTGTREARAELPNPDGALRPGQFVRVVLRGASVPNAVAVPQRAVLESPQGGKFVYVVDEKGTAQPRPVEAGDWSGDSWIVSKGLNAGDKVIVDGVMKIGPGAPVKVAEPQKPEAKKK